MPMTPEGGFRAPQRVEDTAHALQDLQQPNTTGVDIIQPGHIFMWRVTNRPGVPIVVDAMPKVDGKFTFLSYWDFDGPSERALNYMAPSDHVEMVSMGQILQQSDSLDEAKKNYNAWADKDRAGVYLGLHTLALDKGLRRVGFENPMANIDQILDEEIRRRASLVDQRVGSWIQKERTRRVGAGRTVIIDYDDSVAVTIANTSDGTPVRADMWNNHNPVNRVEDFSSLSTGMRGLMETMYRTRITSTDLVVVHTRRDADRIHTIAEHLEIPVDQRAETHVRNLMPSDYALIEPLDIGPDDSVDFLKEAVSKGRIIAGAVQRLDFIKMDPIVLDGFEGMMDRLSQTDKGREILQNLRIAYVTEVPKVDDGQKTKVLFDTYTEHAHERIDEINERFRELMGAMGGPVDEDFILANRDSNRRLTGIKHDDLVTGVYPFYDISFQLGQEGLCQTVQEALLIGSFGLKQPKPPVLVLSREVGFAEKAEDFGLPNATIVEDNTNIDEFTDAFVGAYDMALEIRNNPGSALIEAIQQKTADFGDTAGNSFYSEAFRALYEVQQRKQS